MIDLSILSTISLLLLPAAAKQCVNITVPFQLSARNGVFNIPIPQTNLDATTFAQNFTSIRGNFTNTALVDYATVTGDYEISARYCTPDNGTGSNSVLQFLTHGIGFDKSYWDIAYNDFNYSYIDVAVDQYRYSTLSIDRFGIGNSSIADPLNIVQAPAELNAIYKLTMMLRNGTMPGVNQTFNKVVHVGHSFGSSLSYQLVSMYPTASDGLILTGFSQNGSFLPATVASWDSKLARLNDPLRFGSTSASSLEGLISMIPTSEVLSFLGSLNLTLAGFQNIVNGTDVLDLVSGIAGGSPMMQDLPTGYLTWVDAGSNQYAFLLPGYFAPDILIFLESSKQPYTLGEVLTLPSAPTAAPNFKGPVQIVTGEQDAVYCGGDCFMTGDPNLASIPAKAVAAFPVSSAFEAYIQPNTGHAINVHYNSTGAYHVIQNFLSQHGLSSS